MCVFFPKFDPTTLPKQLSACASLHSSFKTLSLFEYLLSVEGTSGKGKRVNRLESEKLLRPEDKSYKFISNFTSNSFKYDVKVRL